MLHRRGRAVINPAENPRESRPANKRPILSTLSSFLSFGWPTLPGLQGWEIVGIPNQSVPEVIGFPPPPPRETLSSRPGRPAPFLLFRPCERVGPRSGGISFRSR